MFDIDIKDRQFEVYILVAVALALNTWDIAFNLGVYGTVFFEKLFSVWVIATTTLLAYWLLEDSKPSLHGFIQFALFLPTLTLIITAIDNTASTDIITDIVITALYLIAFIVTLPVTLYVVLVVTIPDIVELKSRKMIWGLIGIVLIIAVVGLIIGSNHHLLLNCFDFQVSGNDIPANCRA